MNNRREKTSLKKYTSHFIVRFACERELETEQRLQRIDLTSPVCRSRSPDVQPEAQGLSFLLAFSTTSFLQLACPPTAIQSYVESYQRL